MDGWNKWPILGRPFHRNLFWNGFSSPFSGTRKFAVGFGSGVGLTVCLGKLIKWLVGWLVAWLPDWLVGWLAGWLVGWLVGLLFCQFLLLLWGVGLFVGFLLCWFCFFLFLAWFGFWFGCLCAWLFFLFSWLFCGLVVWSVVWFVFLCFFVRFRRAKNIITSMGRDLRPRKRYLKKDPDVAPPNLRVFHTDGGLPLEVCEAPNRRNSHKYQTFLGLNNPKQGELFSQIQNPALQGFCPPPQHRVAIPEHPNPPQAILARPFLGARMRTIALPFSRLNFHCTLMKAFLKTFPKSFVFSINKVASTVH